MNLEEEKKCIKHFPFSSIWDIEKQNALYSFKNDPQEESLNKEFAHVTKMCWLNEHHIPLLLTATSDAVVRIWTHLENQDNFKLLTSWRAIFSGKGGRKKRAAMVIDWHQDRGTLITGGNVDVIRIWDLEKEQKLRDISIGDFRVTSLVRNHLIIFPIPNTNLH